MKGDKMSKSKELEGWKIFLKGRINQEQGNNEKALDYFEKARAIDPNNTHYLNAKVFALQNLDRIDDAMIASIQSKYGTLADTYIGKADKPEPWIKGLEEIVVNIEDFEEKAAAAIKMVW